MRKYEDIRERILTVLSDHKELATPEVARLVEVDSAVVRHHLKQMVIDGLVTHRRLGKRLLMWSLKKEE